MLHDLIAEVRQGLHYAESHEWVKVEGDIATIGISDHAQVFHFLMEHAGSLHRPSF